MTALLLMLAATSCSGACRPDSAPKPVAWQEDSALKGAEESWRKEPKAPSAIPEPPVPSAHGAAAASGARAQGSKGFSRLMTGHTRCRPPNLPPPPLHVPVRDPVFGTRLTRITDPGQLPGVERIRHFYSKANPFNADGTRAILTTSEGAFVLYDTSSWTPIRPLNIGSSTAEVQWHPENPNLLYHLDFVERSPEVRGLFRYDVHDDSKTLLRDFKEYFTARGKLEGNLDRRGRYYAMFGMRSKTDIEAFVYDIQEDRIGPRLPVTPRMAGDWISVSPSGRFVVMMGERSRIYDIQMKHLRDLPEGSFGHGDLCTTEDGRDVLVYDGADRQLDANRNINIADLGTGAERIGVRIGWKSTPHVSCRNLQLPGWALISTQGGDSVYPNHDFEIFWLKLDGSGEVRRLAHHHSSRERGGYFAEQHAVTNGDGSLVLFASNWGSGPVCSYLVELADPIPNPEGCQ